MDWLINKLRHRRPGIHVDGIGPEDRYAPGNWGGNWGSNGMFTASSHMACRAWQKEFDGWPLVDGDCSNLKDQCNPFEAIPMKAYHLYRCGPLCVHEALRVPHDLNRQFVRVSMPNDAPWHEGCTENPLGVQPDGPIYPRRDKFLGYRP